MHDNFLFHIEYVLLLNIL